jgi:hypothetical protein
MTLSNWHSRYAQLHADGQNLLLPTAARARLDVTATLKIGFHLNDIRIKLQFPPHGETQPAPNAKTNLLTLLRKKLQYCVAIIWNTKVGLQ